MPVARYFLFVGGLLLAVLFAFDAFAPKQEAVASTSAPSIDKTVVRIRSDQKLPERVVYDMTLPTIVPPAAKNQIAAAPTPELTAQARVRDTFAQFVPVDARKLDKKPVVKMAEQPQVEQKPAEQKQAEHQAPRKRKVAARPRPAQPPVRLAQQQHFGFFGNNTW